MRFCQLKSPSGPIVAVQAPSGAVIALSMLRSDAPETMEILVKAVANGQLDLRALSAELTALGPDDEARLNAITPDLADFAAPITQPPKFFAIAINGRANWERSIKPEGATAQYFIKLRTCITGPGDPVEIPDIGSVGPEVELAVIIGKGGKHIAESDALDHVFGYTIHNDLTAHDLRSRKSWIKLVRKDGSEEQLTYPGRWKNFDTFSPLGPWLVTPDEVPDPENLRMTAHLNDDLVQDGTTADFVFKVPQLIAFLSEAHTLEPGDIISTGTVPPVAPWTMAGIHLRKYGGQIACEIDGLGRQVNPIKAV
jgi:2-keto-4-pentenoate hydratase/2-oxohepta-3-ene-1,7-dioic acid hydratase in catechol pathway